MAKQKAGKTGKKQVSRYDKILQENIEGALPGLIKNVLKIRVLKSQELPDSLQYTKERKPDVLKKITDENGETFVLHIEFQTKDEMKMVYRMAEYLVMLLRQYDLPVRQYVIYIGEGLPVMPDKLVTGRCYFSYQLVALSSIDYRIFLRSKTPEEKMLAILADFGKDGVKAAITKIAAGVIKNVKGELEKERRKNQFRVLAELRILISENIEIMEHITSFFKVENDIFYKVGEKRGIEKGAEVKSQEVVKNLIEKMGLSDTQVADIAGVPAAFVKKVRRTVKK